MWIISEGLVGQVLIDTSIFCYYYVNSVNNASSVVLTKFHIARSDLCIA